jgi:hypothetical protein
VKVVNIVRVQWPTNKCTSNSYINSSNASAFWAIFNRFARDFKAPPPYSAAASHFVMTPPPAIFCGQVDLQVARQSYLCQVSHIQVMWRRRGLSVAAERAKGGMRPGRHCAGGGIWRGEHAEFGNSAASAELAFRLHCRTDSAVSLVGYSS